MFSFLLSLMMTLSPMAAGGNGHHWGWRNQAPRTVPQVQIVTPRPPSSSPAPGSLPPGNTDPGPRMYNN